MSYIGRVQFSARARDFLFSTASRQALGPTQPLIQWVLQPLSLEGKAAEHEADNSPPSSAKVKNGGAMPPLFHMSSWHGVLLISTGTTLVNTHYRESNNSMEFKV
jgi:hypothetical protein